MNVKRLFFAIAICVAASWTFAQSDFYEGKGGAGISIEVVKAEVKGKFSDEQEWFPDFAVNMIHDDMEKYSAIRMIDGANLEAQMDVDDRNLNSGIFEIKDGLNYEAADNTLFVTLSVTPDGYNLSVRVNKGNETKASHNKNYSVADMNSGLAVKKATADLLEQLGVRLTKKGKENLLAVESTSAAESIEAQKFNAKAQLAQQNGNNIAALAYIVKAKAADSTLRRSSVALSRLGAKISTGDIGNTARNQIQMRKDFIALLDEAEKYFNEKYLIHYVLIGGLKLGTIDYEKKYMSLNFDCNIVADPDAMVIANSIEKSFLKMPDHSNWGVDKRVNVLAGCKARWACFELVSKDGSVVAKSLQWSDTSNYIRRGDLQYSRGREMPKGRDYYKDYEGAAGLLCFGTCSFCVPTNIDTDGLALRLVKVFPCSEVQDKDYYDILAFSEICQDGLYDAAKDKIVYTKNDAREYGEKIDRAFRGKALVDLAKNKCANLSLLTRESFFANYVIEQIPLSSRIKAVVIKDVYQHFLHPSRYSNYDSYREKFKNYQWSGLGLEEMQEVALKKTPEAVLNRDVFALTPDELKVLARNNDIGLPYVPSEVDERELKLNELFSEIVVVDFYDHYRIYRVSEGGYNKLRKMDSKLPAFESCKVTKSFVKQLNKAIKKYYDFKIDFHDAFSECDGAEWRRHTYGADLERAKRMAKDMDENPNHIYLITHDVPEKNGSK